VAEPGGTRDAVHGDRVRRLLQEHDIGLEVREDGAEEREATLSAEPDVVRDEAHGYGQPPRTT